MQGELVLSPQSARFDSQLLDVPAPNALVRDDDSADIDAARQRLSKKHRLVSLTSLHRRRSKKKKDEEEGKEAALGEDLLSKPLGDLSITQQVEVVPIQLGVAGPEIATYDDTHDHYEWAVVYENQRG
ncbi:hypothetical protein NMY22_g8429 [Coprinellus aureogranulatus]|nr:hypothetical protein NMY22_g8429 [Coprinellus aureogranulatus]